MLYVVFVCCLIIVVIFMGLGRACRFGEILKSTYGWQATKRWGHFYGGSWPLETQCKDFNLATGRGLGWKEWLKNEGGEDFIFHTIISFLVEILLVKIPLCSVCLNLNHEKYKIVTRMWKIEKIVMFVKTCDHYHHKFDFGNFFSCPVICKRIWNWNFDRNLIMALVIMAVCIVLSEKLHAILIR